MASILTGIDHHTGIMSKGSTGVCCEYRRCRRPFSASACWLVACSQQERARDAEPDFQLGACLVILQHNDQVKGLSRCLLRVQALQEAVQRICLLACGLLTARAGTQCRA